MPPEDTQEQFMYPPPSWLAPGSYTGRITNARVEGERLHTEFEIQARTEPTRSNREQVDNTLTLERLRSLFERLSFEANWSHTTGGTRYNQPSRRFRSPVEQQPQRNPNCRAFPHRSNP